MPQLSGAALVNPASSIGRSWAAQLPTLLDAVAALPAGAQAPAYDALAAPILAGISTGDDPLQLLQRRADLEESNPLARAATLLMRMQQAAATVLATMTHMTIMTIMTQMTILHKDQVTIITPIAIMTIIANSR